MTIAQGNTTRIGRRLAAALLAAGGLGVWGLSYSAAQEKTPEQLQRELEEAKKDPNRFVQEQARLNAERRQAASTQPAVGENAPVRPRTMQEFNNRQRELHASTRPGDDIKTQAEEIEAVDEEELAELEAKAREEAGAPHPAPPPPGMAPTGPGARPTTPNMPGIHGGRAPNQPITTRPAGPNMPAPGMAPGMTTQPAGVRSPIVAPGTTTQGPTATQPGITRPGGIAPAPGGVTAPGTGITGTTPPQNAPDLKANPKWWVLPAADRPYFFSWNNTPLQKTLQDIGEMSGLTVVTSQLAQPDLQKQITFQSVKIMSYDEALAVYNELVFDMNYWLVQRESYLVIRPLSEWYRHIPPAHMYASVEEYRKAKLPKWEVASVIYEPKYELPETLANTANDLVPVNGARAVILPNSSRIQLTGFVYFIEYQLAIIARRDVPPGEEDRPLRTYQLKYASVEDAARMLRAMLPTSTGGGGSPVPPNPANPNPQGGRPGGAPAAATVNAGVSMADVVEIQEDQRADRLLIKCTPIKHELVKEYLETYIDTPIQQNQGNVKLFPLQHADPNDLVDIIKPLLGKQQVVQLPPPNPNNPQPQPPQPVPPGRGGRGPGMPTINVGTSAILTPIPESRSILVKANRDEMTQIEDYIKRLDVEQQNKKFQYIQLERANAGSVATVLTSILGQRGPSRGPGQMAFTAVSDPQNDRGLVLHGDVQDLTDAKELIKQLDVDPDQGASEHIVQLAHADADTVSELLSSRYPSPGVTSSSYGSYSFRRGGGSSGLPRFIADSTAKMLIVLCREETWPDIQRLIKEIDEGSTTKATTRLYRLKHVAPGTLADILSQSLGGMSGGYSRRWGMGGGGASQGPSFQYDPGGNVLLVTALEEMHVRAAELIKELDQPGPADNVQPRPIQLTKADPAYVAQQIEDLIGESRGRRNGFGYGYGGREELPKPEVRVVAEEVTNRVFVTASDEDFKKAETLAKEIDQQYASIEYLRKIFVLQHTQADDVRDVLETMFVETGGGGGYGGYGDDEGYGGFRRRNRRSRSNQPGAVRFDDMGDHLVVMAPKDKMAQIEEVIKELDADTASENQIKGYKVAGAGTQGTFEIARTLEQLFGEGGGGGGGYYGGGRGRGGNSKVRFIGNYGSDILLVSAPAARMPEIDQKIQELMKLQDTQDLSFVIRHFDITQARPDDMAEIIEPVLETRFQDLQQKSGGRGGYGGWGYFGGSSQPRVTAHKGARRIMVSAPESMMPLVTELLKEFDQPPEPSTTKIVTLKTAKAQEVVGAVEQMMSERRSGGGSFASRRRPWMFWGGDGGGSSRGSGESDQLIMTAVDSSNSILLKGSLDKIIDAEQLIKTLDKEAVGDGPIIKVFTLQHADTYEVVEMIEDMAGGGSSSSSSYDYSYSPRRSSGAGGVVVKSDYYSKNIIVAAPRDKLPMIEQIVQMKEAMAETMAQMPDAGGSGTVISSGRGEITKRYDVKGAVNETAETLDKILVATYGLMDAPFVKAFPYASQIIVTGKPEHFKEVENWLNRFEKEPVQAKYAVLVKPVKVRPSEVVGMLQQSLPSDQAGKVSIAPVPRAGRQDPLKHIRERNWWDPPSTGTSTQPAANLPVQPSVRSTALRPTASPFVPTNELAEMRAAMSALSWAQAATITTSQPATTQPATTQPAAAGTQPATPAPAPSTQPAVAAAPAAPATQPAVAAAPATQPAVAAAPATPATQPAVAAKPPSPATQPAVAVAPPAPAATQPAAIVRVIPTTQPAVAARPPAPAAAATTAQPVAPAPMVQAPAPAVQPPAPAADPPKPAGPTVTSVVAKPPAREPSPADLLDESENPAEQTRQEALDAALAAKASGKIQIRYDEEKGVIYVAGPAHEVENYKKFIDDITESLEKIQGEEKTPSDIRVFELRDIDVTVAAGILEQMFNDKQAAPGQPQPGQQGRRPNQNQNNQQGNQPNKPGENEEGGNRRRRQEEENKEDQDAAAKAALGGQRIRVFADARTRTIIVRAAQEDFPKIAELILKIDRPSDNPPTEIKIFQLEKLNAYDVETALKAVLKIEDPNRRIGMMNRGGFGRMGGMGAGGMNAEAMIERLEAQMLELEMQQVNAAPAQPGQPGAEGDGKLLKLNPSKDISLTSDATTNSIIVSAPHEGMAIVEKLIKELENQNIPMQIETIPINHADAQQVADTLQRLFQSGGGNRGGGGGGRAGMGPGGFPGGGFDTARSGEIRVSADTRTNTIIVKALEPDMKKIKPIIAEIDKDAGAGVFQLYAVQNGDATEMAANLTKVFADDARGSRSLQIAADANTNTILVRAPEYQQKLIGDKIKEIDAKGGETAKTREIQLLFANAESVATKLQEIYIGSRGRQRGGTRIRIEGDSNSNTLFVTAPEDLFKQIEATVKTIDQAGNTDIRVYVLKYAYASEVITQFEKMTMQLMQQMGGKGAFGGEALAASADARTNSIVVAGTKKTHLAVEKVIKELDIPPGDKTTITSAMFGLTKSSAAAVAASINALFAGQKFPGGVAPPTAVAEPNSNVVFVYGTKAQMDQIKSAIIDPLEDYKVRATDLIKEYQIPVKHMNVEEAAATLTTYFTTRNQNLRAAVSAPSPTDLVITIVPDSAGRQLLVNTGEANKKYIDDFLKAHDTPEASGAGRQVRVFPVTYANITYTVQAINQAFAPAAAKVSVNEQVVAVPEVGTQSIVVRANAENMKKVESLLAELDKSDATRANLVEIVKVRNQRATELATSLTAMIRTKYRINQSTGTYPVAVTPNDTSNTILINAAAKELEEMKALVAKLDTQPASDDERLLRPYPVQFADLSSIVAVITGSFASNASRPLSDQVTATPEYGTSSVVVTASAENHAKVDALIKQLDRPDFAGRKNTRVIPLQHARASEVATSLNNALRATGMVNRSRGTTTATVQPNDATNVLLVTANEQEFKGIEELVKILDVKADTERVLRPYTVKYADLSSVVAAVNSAFSVSAASKNIRDMVAAVAEPGTMSLIVMATEENHQKVQELLSQVDKADTGRQTFSIEVAHAEPEDVAAALTEIYATAKQATRSGRLPASFTVPRGSRRIMVTAMPTELEDIKKLVAQLDVKEADSSSRATRVVQVQHITPDEMNTILTEFMRKPGRTGRADPQLMGDVKIMTSTSAGVVVLNGPKDRLDELEQLAMKVDQAVPAGAEGRSRQISVFALKNADPSSVASVITQSFAKYSSQVAEADRINAVAEWATNSVVVTANAEKLADIQKMIETLDQKPTAGQQVIIPLKYARAEDLAAVLRQTYASSRRMRQGDVPITVTPDANSNAIIVAANPADMEGVKLMVADLDKPATLPDEELRIIPLQFIDANETLVILTEYLRKPGGTRGATGSQLVGDVRLQASATMNSIIVSGSGPQIDRVQEVLKTMDKEVAGAGTAPRIVPIRKANAAQLAQTLSRIFTDTARQRSGRQGSSPDLVPVILSDEATNSLVVRARQVDFNLIEEMAQKLDTDVPSSGFRIVPVQPGVDIRALATEIEKTVNQGEQAKVSQQPNYRPGQVSVGVDYRAPALIVGGTPELFEQVESLVKGLAEIRPGGFRQSAVIIPTKNLDPTEVKRVIEQIMQQRNGGPKR